MLRRQKSNTLVSRETLNLARRERRVVFNFLLKKKIEFLLPKMLKLETMRRSLRAELRVSRDKRVSDF